MTSRVWCWRCDLWHTELEFIEEWTPLQNDD